MPHSLASPRTPRRPPDDCTVHVHSVFLVHTRPPPPMACRTHYRSTVVVTSSIERRYQLPADVPTACRGPLLILSDCVRYVWRREQAPAAHNSKRRSAHPRSTARRASRAKSFHDSTTCDAPRTATPFALRDAIAACPRPSLTRPPLPVATARAAPSGHEAPHPTPLHHPCSRGALSIPHSTAPLSPPPSAAGGATNPPPPGGINRWPA